MTGWSRRFAAFLVVLAVLHFMLRVGFGMGDTAPDFLIVAGLLAARRLTIPWAAVVGLVLGTLNDTFALTGFGATGFALALVAALGGASRDFFEGDSPFFIFGYLLLGTWLVNTITIVIDRTAVDGPLPLLMLGNIGVAMWAASGGLAAAHVFRAVSKERT
jgi:hypothetical protein